MEKRAYKSLARHLANILNRNAGIEAGGIAFGQFLWRKLLFSPYHMAYTYILTHLCHLLFRGHSCHQIAYTTLNRQSGVGIIGTFFS